MKKVVFYTDKPGCSQPSQDVQKKVLARFETNVAYFCHATAIAGFESGVDWEKLDREGAVAVVLYNMNDAGVFGISIEAGLYLEVYELYNDRLWKTLDIQITGKVPVMDPAGTIQLPEGDGAFDPTGADGTTPSHHGPNSCP